MASLAGGIGTIGKIVPTPQLSTQLGSIFVNLNNIRMAVVKSSVRKAEVSIQLNIVRRCAQTSSQWK
jgi:hypothetical protein